MYLTTCIEIMPQFQEPAMVNESNSEELETERDDQGFEKETAECPEKSDKKENQSMGKNRSRDNPAQGIYPM